MARPPKLPRKTLRLLEGAVGDKHGAGSPLHKVAGGQLAHFAGAHQQDCFLLERAKDFCASSTATEAIETEEAPISFRCVSAWRPRRRVAAASPDGVRTAPTDRAAK